MEGDSRGNETKKESEELERGAVWKGGISEEPDMCEDPANNRHVNEQI